MSARSPAEVRMERAAGHGAHAEYAEAIECDLPRLDFHDPDWSLIENA